MADSDVQIGKEGVKLSYRRLLADSAAGFALTSLLVLYLGIQYDFPLATEARAFLLLVMFILAAPIGFCINAFSWFLLGNLVNQIQKTLIFAKTHLQDKKSTGRQAKGTENSGMSRQSPLAWLRWLPGTIKIWYHPTRRAFLLEDYRIDFYITDDNWYERISEMEGVLSVYHPGITQHYDYVEGLEILLRNLALLTMIPCGINLLLALYAGFDAMWPHYIPGTVYRRFDIINLTMSFVGWFMVSYIFLLSTGYVAYYNTLSVIYYFHMLYLRIPRYRLTDIESPNKFPSDNARFEHILREVALLGTGK